MVENKVKKEILEKTRKKYIEKRLEKKEIQKLQVAYGDVVSFKEIGEKFIEKQPIFYDSNKQWWLWNFVDCFWKLIDEVDLMNAFDNFHKMNSFEPKIKTQIIDGIKRAARLNKPKEPKRTWIQFKDTIIDVMTGEEFKATPKYFMTNPIPWKLGDSEETPTIDRLFRDWAVTEDKQDESYIQTLYEIISYIPLMDYPLHLIFAFTGDGLNGKGSFLRLCEKFVGRKNCISSDWDLLTQSNFETSNFYKKLMCGMGDIDKGIFKKTKWIKRLTGQDTIPMQFKHKPRFDERNYAKILVATNNIPETTDKSIGFYRRWCIVDFFNTFKERGVDIVETIPDVEFENLARKSVGILKSVLEKGKITNQGTIPERKKKYEEHTSSIGDFIDEYCEEDLISDISFGDFWYQYNSWLKSNGLNMQSKPEVSKQLTNKAYIIKNKRVMKTNNEGVEYPSTLKVIVGIKWKYEEEAEPEVI
ncbi:MAG: DNA primase family protein [Candidatus Heimdallarchaeaceae archaeon]